MHLPTALAMVVIVLFVIPVVIALATHRLTIVLPIALVVTGGASFWVWTDLGEPQVLGAIEAVEGNQLVVSYVGSECEDQRSVSVDEGETSVRVKVVARSFASGCSDVGVHRQVSITLDRPLGSRGVVNVGCTPDRIGCEKLLTPPT
jgi:asparagine N-glycosylation enzyme membrane subunit Stt3